MSTTTVRRALGMPVPDAAVTTDPDTARTDDADAATGTAAAGTGNTGAVEGSGEQPDGLHAAGTGAAKLLEGPAPAPGSPVLPEPVDWSGERALARFALIEHAPPVFAPAGRVPLAGLLLALPALEATGLLGCARRVFGALPNGFYGLESVLLEAVLRTLAGEARAEGATRIDPVAFGRVLELDRSPQVKTIRRRLGLLAGAGTADR